MTLTSGTFISPCTHYVPHRRGGGHIVFGADPVGVGVSVGVTLSCLHDISLLGGRKEVVRFW